MPWGDLTPDDIEADDDSGILPPEVRRLVRSPERQAELDAAEDRFFETYGLSGADSLIVDELMSDVTQRDTPPPVQPISSSFYRMPAWEAQLHQRMRDFADFGKPPHSLPPYYDEFLKSQQYPHLNKRSIENRSVVWSSRQDRIRERELYREAVDKRFLESSDQQNPVPVRELILSRSRVLKLYRTYALQGKLPTDHQLEAAMYPTDMQVPLTPYHPPLEGTDEYEEWKDQLIPPSPHRYQYEEMQEWRKAAERDFILRERARKSFAALHRQRQLILQQKDAFMDPALMQRELAKAGRENRSNESASETPSSSAADVPLTALTSADIYHQTIASLQSRILRRYRSIRKVMGWVDRVVQADQRLHVEKSIRRGPISNLSGQQPVKKASESQILLSLYAKYAPVDYTGKQLNLYAPSSAASVALADSASNTITVSGASNTGAAESNMAVSSPSAGSNSNDWNWLSAVQPKLGELSSDPLHAPSVADNRMLPHPSPELSARAAFSAVISREEAVKTALYWKRERKLVQEQSQLPAGQLQQEGRLSPSRTALEYNLSVRAAFDPMAHPFGESQELSTEALADQEQLSQQHPDVFSSVPAFPRATYANFVQQLLSYPEILVGDDDEIITSSLQDQPASSSPSAAAVSSVVDTVAALSPAERQSRTRPIPYVSPAEDAHATSALERARLRQPDLDPVTGTPPLTSDEHALLTEYRQSYIDHKAVSEVWRKEMDEYQYAHWRSQSRVCALLLSLLLPGTE